MPRLRTDRQTHVKVEQYSAWAESAINSSEIKVDKEHQHHEISLSFSLSSLFKFFHLWVRG